MNKQDAYAYFGYDMAQSLERDPSLREQAIASARRKGDGWKLSLLIALEK